MRERKADDVRQRRMECLMGPFRDESFTGYVTFTRNVEILAYHAWSCTELALYRGAWQQVPLYIQFIVITRATSNMPKYIGFTKPAAHTWKSKNAFVVNYWPLRTIFSLLYSDVTFLSIDNYISVLSVRAGIVLIAINKKNFHMDMLFKY